LQNQLIFSVLKEGFVLALTFSAPVLVVCLLIGIIVSFLQAVTQIQDQSVSFVPKLLAVVLLIAVMGASALRGVTDFASSLFVSIGIH